MSETVTTVNEVGQAVSKCVRRDPDWVSYHASELAEAAHAAPVNALALKVAGAERKAFKLQRLVQFEKALHILEKLTADEELKGDAQRRAWLAATAARIAYQINNADRDQKLQTYAFSVSDNQVYGAPNSRQAVDRDRSANGGVRSSRCAAR